MCRKWLTLICIILCTTLFQSVVHGEGKTERILLLYTNDTNAVTENVQKLDLLLHHFSDEVTIVSAEDVTEEQLTDARTIVYYGEDKGRLNDQLIKALGETDQTVLAIGENTTSFLPFKIDGERTIKSIGVKSYAQNFPLAEEVKLQKIEVEEKMDVLLYGYDGNRAVPLMVGNGQYYLIGTNVLDDMIVRHLADRLHDVLPNDHVAEQLAYIRLENIHPQTDPEVLREVGELLYEKDIPFLLALRPVYVNPETNDMTTLKEEQKLVTVLQDLQMMGGTIIANGYNHNQFAGTEFWDMVHDQPMIDIGPNETSMPRQKKEQFSNSAQFEQYEEEMKVAEKTYVQKRLEQSLHDLVREDIFPLAFAPPFHAMSQEAYAETAQYVQTLIGNVQLLDRSAETVYAPPFVTSASFLHGLTVYPETVGDMSDHAKSTARLLEAQIVRDGVIGMSFQTYMGAEALAIQLEKLEKLHHLKWLDLRKIEQDIRTDKLQLSSKSDGELTLVTHFAWKDRVKEWTDQFTLLEKILWVVTLLVLIFVVLFLLFALSLRLQLKKRLFRERK